jgi:hypothetical protein
MKGKVCLQVEYKELKECWRVENHHRETNEKVNREVHQRYVIHRVG